MWPCTEFSSFSYLRRRRAASRRVAYCPRGPARCFPASQLRGVRRETRAGMQAGEETMPVMAPKEIRLFSLWRGKLRAGNSPSLGKTGKIHPVRSVLGLIALHTSPWVVETGVAPRKCNPGRASGASGAAEPSTRSGKGVPSWEGQPRENLHFLKPRFKKPITPQRHASCDVQHNVLLKYRNLPPNGGFCSWLH